MKARIQWRSGVHNDQAAAALGTSLDLEKSPPGQELLSFLAQGTTLLLHSLTPTILCAVHFDRDADSHFARPHAELSVTPILPVLQTTLLSHPLASVPLSAHMLCQGDKSGVCGQTPESHPEHPFPLPLVERVCWSHPHRVVKHSAHSKVCRTVRFANRRSISRLRVSQHAIRAFSCHL